MEAKSRLERTTEEMRQRCAAFLSPAFAATCVASSIGETGAPDGSVDIVRVLPDRFTLRYRFPSGSVVYAKAYSGRQGSRLFTTLRELWEAGFNDTGWLRVPQPLAFLEEDNVVLMREARGAPLSRQLPGCPLETAIARVRAAARWLLALHTARLSCLEPNSPCQGSKILKASDILAKAASARPEHSSALLEFLGYVEKLAQGSAADPVLTPTHGQFAPKNVFVDSDAVTAIDLDTMSLSDPAVDVAKFVSKLKYRKLFKAAGESVRAARLASEFLDEYARSAGGNLANLPYYLALYGLKEFSKALSAPDADRVSADRAQRLCRRELQRCLRDGAPERSLPGRKKAEKSKADVSAAWSALCSTRSDADGKSWQEACEAKATVVQAKHTARPTLCLTTHSGSCLYAKWYPDHLGRRCAKVATALWASGFGHDSPYRVPEVAVFLPDRTVLLLHAADGVPLSAVLETGSVAEAVRGARDAARWLAALHRSPVRVGSAELDWISLKAFRVPQRLIEVCAQFPDQAGPLLKILYQLRPCAARLVAAPSLVQTHGSYRPKHVFIADGVTTAIDLDRSRPADPAKDVAEFITDLRSAACDRSYDCRGAEQAAEAFLEEYLSQAPGMETRVACYAAGYLTLRLLKRIREGGVAEPRGSERLDLYREAIGKLCKKH